MTLLPCKPASGAWQALALWAAMLAAMLAGCQRAATADPGSLATQRDGVLETIESEYNAIAVEKSGPIVSLKFTYRNQRYTESAIDLTRPGELIVPYTRYMSVALAYATRPVERIGLVGLGGGRTIAYLLASLPKAKAEVAELDPAVIGVAQRYFGIQQSDRLRVSAADGRLFFVDAKPGFDLILLDAYRGPFVPYHLTTKEYYQMLQSRLAPGGVVAQNVEPTTLYFDSALKTMRAVFDQVDAFEAHGNVVLIGYSGPRRSDADLAAAAAKVQSQYNLRHDLRELVQARRSVELDPKARLLTDDFAPVDALNSVRRHNEKRK